MAGPEPYPQYKATDAELQAHADRRADDKKRARSSQSKKSVRKTSSGGGRKRYVRTAQGERRYGKPIGTEIGQARNAGAAHAQQDKESTDRYGQLVGTDRSAQAKAMGSLNDDQLQRLSRVAYSFRSSNPDVVRLRIGVANELRRRGFNVNDFGGLGGRGSTSRSAGPARSRKPSSRKGPVTQTRTQKAMAAMYGPNRKVNLSTPAQLRAAVQVFPKVSTENRQAVARVLVRSAIELGAPHFLGESIVEAANIEPGSDLGQQVLELAGKWRHGWIPLDATATSVKMKGNTGGKQWWDGKSSGNRGEVTARSRKGRIVPQHEGGKLYPKNTNGPDAGKRRMLTSKDTKNRFTPLDRAERSDEDDEDYFSGLDIPKSERHDETQAKGSKTDQVLFRKTGKATAAQRREAERKVRDERGRAAAAKKFEANKPKSDADYAASAGKREASAAQKRAELEESKRGPDRIPGQFGTGERFEWRKQADGTYTRYINGRKSKSVADQGHTMASIRRHNKNVKGYRSQVRANDRAAGRNPSRFGASERKSNEAAKASALASNLADRSRTRSGDLSDEQLANLRQRRDAATRAGKSAEASRLSRMIDDEQAKRRAKKPRGYGAPAAPRNYGTTEAKRSGKA